MKAIIFGHEGPTKKQVEEQPDMFPTHQHLIKRKKSEQQKYNEIMVNKYQESLFKGGS